MQQGRQPAMRLPRDKATSSKGADGLDNTDLPHVYRTDKRGGRTSTENGYSRQVVYLSWEEGGGRSRPARVGPHLTAEGRSRRAAVSQSVSPPAGKGKVAHAWVAGPELTTRERVLAPPPSSASGCAASGGQGGDRGTTLAGAGAAAVCWCCCHCRCRGRYSTKWRAGPGPCLPTRAGYFLCRAECSVPMCRRAGTHHDVAWVRQHSQARNHPLTHPTRSLPTPCRRPPVPVLVPSLCCLTAP